MSEKQKQAALRRWKDPEYRKNLLRSLRQAARKARWLVTDWKERFWSKVDKTPGYGPKGTCWGWKGSLNKDGYGHFYHNERGAKEGRSASYSAHRVAWEVQRGPIPEGESVLHHCDYRQCTRADNDEHLFLGTQTDNMRDAAEKGNLGPSEDGKRRISEANTGRRFSRKTREMMSKAQRERYARNSPLVRSEIHRERLRASMLGKKATPQARRNMSMARQRFLNRKRGEE